MILLKTYARAACFELTGDSAYYSNEKLAVYLNGKHCIDIDKNVFSIFNLEPATSYCVEVANKVIVFKTEAEAALIEIDGWLPANNGLVLTNYLQAAINSCPQGGTIYFAAGTYLTGPLFLKSDINIYLAKGAELLAIPERNDYPVLPARLPVDNKVISSWEGEPNQAFASLITAVNISNVNIYGEGIINGNADNPRADWWHDCTTKRGAWRPRTVFMAQCHNITMCGVTVKNSPSWTVHPLLSHKLSFFNLNIENPPNSPNTDGLNPEMSEQVEIIGTRISVGDDCIAIKAGKGEWARKEGAPCRYLTIRNCLMQFGHGAVVLGSEMSAGVGEIVVQNCIFEGTDRGIRLKTRRGRGGYLDGLYVSNIKMLGVMTPFTINSYYFCCDPDGKSDYVASKEPQPITDGTPVIKNLILSDIEATDAHVAASFIYGLPEKLIENVKITNMHVSFAENPTPEYPAMMRDLEKQTKGNYFFANIKNLKLTNVKAEGYDEYKGE
ncbi:MAG: glycoside hydrolase family 28 protein [Spirochaetaceae bacterium]|nr:glycoside hydrolase family 28 protein [Spirochaetaceae bacterium]